MNEDVTYDIRYMPNRSKFCDLGGWEVYNTNNGMGHSWYRTEQAARREANAFNRCITDFYQGKR